MKSLLHPRANTAANDAFTGAASQLTVDTERNEIRLHDDATPGGHRILNLAQLVLLFMSKDSEFGQVSFIEGERGFLTRIGDKQYALRDMTAGNGITITNPEGEADNPTFSVDESYLSNLLINTAAGKLLYAGLTGGSETAFTIATSAEWANVNSSILSFVLHATPGVNPTLNVNGAGALPLVTGDDSTLVSQAAPIGSLVLAMRVDDEYRLIGLQVPAKMGISAIEGLVATTLQAALAELTARIIVLEEGAGAAGSSSEPVDSWRFGVLGDSIVGFITQETVPVDTAAWNHLGGAVDPSVVGYIHPNRQAKLVYFRTSTGSGTMDSESVDTDHYVVITNIDGNYYTGEITVTAAAGYKPTGFYAVKNWESHGATFNITPSGLGAAYRVSGVGVPWGH